MRLGYTFLQNFNGLNSFEEVQTLNITQGNTTNVYFRFVDLDQPNDCNEYLRYVPCADSTCIITIKMMDQTPITRVATMPFPNDDRSLWMFTVLPTDMFTADSISIQLTSCGVTYNAVGVSKLVMSPTNSSYC